MRVLFAALLALSVANISSRADVAPSYPEFHAGVDIAEGQPYPKITSVTKNSPAEKSGVKVGDMVLALNNAYGKARVPFYFWMKGLRGPKNSKVRLILLRNDAEVIVTDIARTISVR